MLLTMCANAHPRLRHAVGQPILVQVVFANVEQMTRVVFPVKLVNLELANVVLQIRARDKHLDPIVMLQIMSVSAPPRLTPVLEQLILVLVEFANVVHPMLAAFQGRHVAQVHVSAVRRRVVLA